MCDAKADTKSKHLCEFSQCVKSGVGYNSMKDGTQLFVECVAELHNINVTDMYL